MAYDLLTLDIEHRLAVVRLNRPEARNALSQALMRELIRCAMSWPSAATSTWCCSPAARSACRRALT